MLTSRGTLDHLPPSQFVETLAALFDPMPAGVSYCRIDQAPGSPAKLTYLYTNPAFHTLTGTGAVEGGRNSELLPGMYPSDTAMSDLYARVDATGMAESFEFHLGPLQQLVRVQVTSPNPGHVLAMVTPEKEQKASALDVRTTDARFHNLVTHNHAVILQIEPRSGKILDANPAAVAFYGWSHEALCAMSIQDINTLSPDEVAKERRAALDERRKYFVFPHRLANGDIRTVEVHSTPIDVDGQPILVSIIHDITPRVEAERQLKETLAEQHAILTSEIVGIVKLRNRAFEWLNQPFARMLGYTQEELLHQSTRILYASDTAYNEFAALAYPVLESGGTFHTEWQYVHKDGSWRWYELSGTALLPGSDQSIWYFQDISERKWAKEALEKLTQTLAESEEHLAYAQSIAKVGSWHVFFGEDEAQDQWTISQELRRLYEYPADQVVDTGSGFAPMPEEDQEFTRQAWAAAKAGRGPYTWQHRIVVNGHTKWLQVACNFKYDSDGKALEASGTSQDITELKRLQDAPAEAFERLQKIASRVPGVLYQFRMYPDGRSCFPFASGGIKDIYGIHPADVVDDATPAIAMVHPDDLAMVTASINDSSKMLTPWQQEYRVRFADGAVHWLYGNAVPQREADGSTLWHGFITDVTERKKTDDLVRKLSTAVEQSPTSIVITDLDANIEYVNPQFTTTTGYQPEEVMGKNPRIIQSKLTPPQTYADMWKSLGSGQPWTGELINRRKNGELYWEESRIAPVKAADGKVTHYVAVKADVTQRVRAAERLDELLRDQQAMLNNDLVGIVKVKDRHVIWANTAFEQMFGYASGELKGTSTRQTYKDDASYESFGAEAYPALKAGTAYRSQIEQRCKDGKLIWVDVSGERLNATTGESLWTFLDITERKAMESQLTLSEAKLRGVIEGAADAIFVVNQTGQYQYTNQQATRLLGYTPQEYLSMSLTDITPPEDVEDVTRQFQELLSTGVLRTELRLKRKDGALAPVELNASMLPDGTLFGSCRDIFKRKQMEDQIRQLAFHDTLTQLPNRRLLLDRLNNAMSASKRSGKYGALMFLDLDHFKPLNDEHGHEAGDVLLVEAARRLKHCVREIDTVARFGGDEFTVMLSELNADKNESTKQACAVAEKIRNALAEPYQIVLSHGDSVTTSITHHCTASIGVALFINHFGSATDILSWADGAMYAAKSGGRNRVHLYQEASAR